MYNIQIALDEIDIVGLILLVLFLKNTILIIFVLYIYNFNPIKFEICEIAVNQEVLYINSFIIDYTHTQTRE
jgi:hypothetical protein